MSFSLSSLGSLVSDAASIVTDPGKVVTDVVNSVLPQNMKAVGDIAGGIVDYETGHPLQALGHLTDTLKDLPQLLQGLSTTTSAGPTGAAGGSPAAEPTPPAPRAPAQVAAQTVTVSLGGSQANATSAAPQTGTQVSISLPAGARPGDQISISLNANAGSVTISDRAAPQPRGFPIRVPTDATQAWRSAASGASVSVVTAGSNAAPAASTASGGSANPTSSKPAGGANGSNATSNANGTNASTSTSSSSGAASTDAPASGGSSTSSTSKGASTSTPSSLSDLMALSPDQFMQAVTSGKIPPDVANNPSAMTQIQARMNQITQMNQLVTSMMAAMHQMQMSIIQNIRA